MSFALRKEDYELGFEPPAIAWQKAFDAVGTIRDFVKLVDSAEHQSLLWYTLICT